MTKFYFRSLHFYAGSLFPKAVRGKSSYDVNFFNFLIFLRTRNIFSSVTVNIFINWRLNNNIPNSKKICV